MAAPSYLQVTPVAVDGSPNTVQRTINTLEVLMEVRPATPNEIAAFPTAQTAVIYRVVEGQTVRFRTLLTATPYATINTALTA